MRLDKCRDSSDLIETFKILNGNYSMVRNLFFATDDGGGGGGTPQNCLKDSVYQIIENLF